MTIIDRINEDLGSRSLAMLTQEQAACLHDPSRLEEAAGMLADLRDRCAVRLPLPSGLDLGGPYESEEEAREAAEKHCQSYPVITVDEMATDDSRSNGVGDEFYVTAHTGPSAALVVSDPGRWVACWVSGTELVSYSDMHAS